MRLKNCFSHHYLGNLRATHLKYTQVTEINVNNISAQDSLADVEHNKTDRFVAVATSEASVLPRYARLPINRCNLPAVILGGLTFQSASQAIYLDGIAQFHRGFFSLLEQLDCENERALAFIKHMNASFYLNDPEQVGYSAQIGNKRHKADYWRMLRGWGFDSNGREGAALKGWVESRFGLLPRHHAGPIRDFSGAAYRRYLGMRAAALYGTNAIEAQLDLLYSYCQYELSKQYSVTEHLTLYRGVNSVDDYETLAKIDKKRRVVLFNNLSSFTANRERADEFGDYLLTARVPLSKIFFHTRLLPGLLQGEDEFAVIGGLYEVSIAAY
jgi:NAD+--dinitrogen-reductase ADP-D-ribosyltransferase